MSGPRVVALTWCPVTTIRVIVLTNIAHSSLAAQAHQGNTGRDIVNISDIEKQSKAIGILKTASPRTT